jgi:hypothetical protein
LRTLTLPLSLLWLRFTLVAGGCVFLRAGQSITAQYPAMPSTAAVITGGPSSSGPAIPPCADAFEYQSATQITAIIADRKAVVLVNIVKSPD